MRAYQRPRRHTGPPGRHRGGRHRATRGSGTRKEKLRRLPSVLGGAIGLVVRASPGMALSMLALQIAATAAQGLLLLLLRNALDSVTALTADQSVVRALLPSLSLFGTVLLVSTVASLLLPALRLVLTERISWYTVEKVLDVTTAVPLSEFDRPAFHERLSRAQSAASRPALITQSLFFFIGSVSTITSVIAVLLTVQPLLVAVLGAMVLPLVLASGRASRGMYELIVALTEDERRRAYLRGLLMNRESAAEVRSYRLTGRLRRRGEELFDSRIRQMRRVVLRSLPGYLVGGLAMTLAVAFGVVLLLTLVVRGQITVATATVGVFAVLQYSGALSTAATSLNQLYDSALYLEDFRAFRTMLPALLAEQRKPTRPAPRDFDLITVDGVSFRYPGAGRPALQDVSLTLRRGELVALVGGNGSGKTTLAKLLCDLYRPDQGRIRWDGVDIADVDPDELRESIAVLFQNFGRYLFTAAENIGVGRVENSDDRGAIVMAAERARADTFIRALEEGYDTTLGKVFKGSTDLSGGQWQSIALARAFFRAAPLVVLDEPTAALDARAENQLYEGMRELFAGRTVLLISHRLLSVRSADRIYVLDQGSIVESGTHEELMACQGLYAELYCLQATQHHV
ncbi:ABC transporter ATP-binding protein [Streptomyces sp. NBC_00286]|uniref:ABC transporter ATP-binding protein n=1 Tax=Streptomyces sp. NBC_00286 TaxID=2975701 RepID=UPI002E2CA884|nr:ABC transporter ATP-binding protein [Streptomyces sp. NBC_00286]